MDTTTKAGVLGAADGVTSVAGIIAAGAAQHAGHSRLGLIAIGGALSATVSMAGAELLSEDSIDRGAIAAMAVGTLVGAGAPAVPLILVGGALGWVAVAIIALAVTFAVGEVRHRATAAGRARAYGVTVAILAAGALVGFAAGSA